MDGCGQAWTDIDADSPAKMREYCSFLYLAMPVLYGE